MRSFGFCATRHNQSGRMMPGSLSDGEIFVPNKQAVCALSLMATTNYSCHHLGRRRRNYSFVYYKVYDPLGIR